MPNSRIGAGSGRDCLKRLRREPDIDLVLMDMMMPEMNGYTAIRKIREGKNGAVDPRIPIIALTARAMEGDREKCLEAGADRYIAKPVDFDRLLTLIAELVG